MLRKIANILFIPAFLYMGLGAFIVAGADSLILTILWVLSFAIVIGSDHGLMKGVRSELARR